MGFQDRQYNQSGNQGGFGGGGFGGHNVSFGMPSITPMVKILLIINAAAFVAQQFLPEMMVQLFAAAGQPPLVAVQIWRLITFQFLHANFGHILGNMLGLFFFGTILERTWGSSKFLKFYLSCGLVGGALYVLASYFQLWGWSGILMGASGGVFGILTACAILFPNMQVLVMLMFPMSIRVLAIIYGAYALLTVLSNGGNAGGELCHLGGIITAIIWVMGRPKLDQFKNDIGYKVSQKKQQEVKNLEFEVDRILAKVHQQGIQSLTKREKEILKKATDMQKRH